MNWPLENCCPYVCLEPKHGNLNAKKSVSCPSLGLLGCQNLSVVGVGLVLVGAIQTGAVVSFPCIFACMCWLNCLTYWLVGVCSSMTFLLVWLSESFLFPWWWRLVPVASRMWLKVAVLATWPVTLQKCNQLSQSTLVWAKCNWWHFVTFFNDTLFKGVLIQNGWCYSIWHYVTFSYPCDSFCLWLTLKEH